MKRWSEEEDLILVKCYYNSKKDELLKLLPNRSYDSIRMRASIRKYQKTETFSNLLPLLNEEPLSYYWMGFIMADGCFSGNGYNTLEVNLSTKDSSHLEKLALLLNTKCRVYNNRKTKMNKGGITSTIVLTATSNRVGPVVREKFNLLPKKTYNPPKYFPTNDTILLMSLLIGLLDGDGAIIRNHKSFSLKILCHKSWIEFYKNLDSLIFDEPNIVRMEKCRDQCLLSINKRKNIEKLLNLIETYSLPVLSRKWNKITY